MYWISLLGMTIAFDYIQYVKELLSVIVKIWIGLMSNYLLLQMYLTSN